MNAEVLAGIKNKARARQDAIMNAKQPDYTRHESDVLSNFKRAALATGLTPMQVWAVFTLKHIDAIMAFVKTSKIESESLQSRFDDVANYLLLGEALISEIQHPTPVVEAKADPRPMVSGGVR